MASNAAEVAVDFLAMLNGVGIALDGLPFVNWQASAFSCPPSQKQTRMTVAAVGGGNRSDLLEEGWPTDRSADSRGTVEQRPDPERLQCCWSGPRVRPGRAAEHE